MMNPHWASLQICPSVRGTTNPNFLHFRHCFFPLFSDLKYDVNKWGCLFIKALQKRNIWKKEAGKEEEGDIPVKLPGICSLLLGMSA